MAMGSRVLLISSSTCKHYADGRNTATFVWYVYLLTVLSRFAIIVEARVEFCARCIEVESLPIPLTWISNAKQNVRLVPTLGDGMHSTNARSQRPAKRCDTEPFKGCWNDICACH